MLFKYTSNLTQKCLRQKKRCLLIAVILVGMAITYYIMLPYSYDHDDIRRNINLGLTESMKRDKGMGCVPPKLNPFAPEAVQYMSDTGPEIDCKIVDWVECYHDICGVKPSIQARYKNIKCSYSKIIFKHDFDIKPSKKSVTLDGNSTYHLIDTDQVSVSCTGTLVQSNHKQTYQGAVMGIRRVLSKKTPEPKSKYNILFVGFDSVAHNYVKRSMRNLYEALQHEFGAVIMETYNIVGDGTPAALTPIFTGMSEPELPEVRRSKQKYGGPQHTVDEFPFIFKMLRKIGFRTAYLEDEPWVGTWQYRMVGFMQQPSDHYLRSLTMQSWNCERYCHFGTPTHELMLNLTEQVMTIDKKRKFVFTFSATLTHDDYNMAYQADDLTVKLLRRLRDAGALNDTFLIVMGDHGSRYGKLRETLQGKQEERMPLMSFIVPKKFQDERPYAYNNLKKNAKVLTTPFDIHSTLLDVLDLNEHRVHIKVPGSNLPRSLSLLEPIPASRSCSEAGVEPHWCACLEWIRLPPDDVFFKRVANFFVDYINMLTDQFRDKCVKRVLKSVEFVSRQKPNDKMLTYVKPSDTDGFFALFGKATKYTINYQVKLTVGPGDGMFEATLTYSNSKDELSLATRDISRVNAYNTEPKCISSIRPDLNMFCYCASSEN